jgi:hypothetical protein
MTSESSMSQKESDQGGTHEQGTAEATEREALTS